VTCLWQKQERDAATYTETVDLADIFNTQPSNMSQVRGHGRPSSVTEIRWFKLRRKKNLTARRKGAGRSAWAQGEKPSERRKTTASVDRTQQSLTGEKAASWTLPNKNLGKKKKGYGILKKG